MSVDAGVTAGMRRDKVPWSFSVARRVPLPTWVTGLVFGLALVLALVLVELLSSRPQAIARGVSPEAAGCLYLLGDYRIGLVGMIALAYATTARYKLSQWTFETLLLLGRPNDEDAESLACSKWWGFLPGLAGIAICLGAAVDIAERDVEWTRAYWIWPHIVNWGWCFPFGWVGGRLIYSVFTNAAIVARAARSIEVTDLNNTRAVDAAVRHGMRSSLISLMFLGIISVHFLDPGLDFPTIIVLIVLYVIGAAISALPTAGVMQIYYDKRDEELASLRAEIALEEEQLLKKDPDYEPGRIGDLVSMEQRLSNWTVTIFRFSTMTRLGLYVFIGLLSWVGAAAVSVVVETAFGF